MELKVCEEKHKRLEEKLMYMILDLMIMGKELIR